MAEEKPELPEDVQQLLMDLRSYLANSNDPWDQRRDLMYRINERVPGGDSDLFVASVREMGRMGASYASMMQQFTQMMASSMPGANFADAFARTFSPNAFVNPAVNEFFRQMNDLMEAQRSAFGVGDKSGKR
ncbi:MAG TPA: hypothetical protein VLW45_00785 [Pelomicrobium sp.]|nr:hypothetical protein [Pelomicrobium sp.]